MYLTSQIKVMTIECECGAFFLNILCKQTLGSMQQLCDATLLVVRKGLVLYTRLHTTTLLLHSLSVTKVVD